MKKKGMVTVALWLLIWSCSTVAVAANTLIPVGKTVGIHLETEGLVVVDLDEDLAVAKDAGIQKGDIIIEIDGETLVNMEEFQTILQKNIGADLSMTIRRGSGELLVVVKDFNGTLGLSLRDGISGIGTVTYYDPATDTYGALGHGVNEPETRMLLPVETGELCPSSVVEVEKGAVGQAGVLRGAFDTDVILGTVEQNTDHGIFGQGGYDLATEAPVEVASPHQVQLGTAEILANIDGVHVTSYTVEIQRINQELGANGKDMVLKITDPALLNATGGIVQGMSGSPILQNGKLIGAVTHVYVI